MCIVLRPTNKCTVYVLIITLAILARSGSLLTSSKTLYVTES